MKELAEFLKNERLDRKLTVEALSALSGISVSMLESFESFDFERFGASILLRKTVRAYCAALHIDAEPLLEKYSSQIEACNVQDAGIRRYERLQKTLRKRRRLVALPIFVFFFFAAAVFYGGMWISKRRSKLYAPPNANWISSQQNLPVDLRELPASGEKTPSAKKPAPETAKADQATVNVAGKTVEKAGVAAGDINTPSQASQKVAASQESTTLPQSPNGQSTQVAAGDINTPSQTSQKVAASQESTTLPQSPNGQSTQAPAGAGAVQNAQARTLNTFTVQADGKVWIQVKIDGKKPQSEMLHAGERREWVAPKGLKVVIGNAGGVQMQWNGQPLAAPHVPGRVLRFRLPDYVNTKAPAQG